MLLLITVLNYKTIVNFFTNSDSSVMYSFFIQVKHFLAKKVLDQRAHLEPFNHLYHIKFDILRIF